MSKLLKLYNDVLATPVKDTKFNPLTTAISQVHRTSSFHPDLHMRQFEMHTELPNQEETRIQFRVKNTDKVFEIREIVLRYLGEDEAFLQTERVELIVTTRTLTQKDMSSNYYSHPGRYTETLTRNAHFVITDSQIEVNQPSVVRTGETTEYDDLFTIVDTIKDVRDVDGLVFYGWCLSQRFIVRDALPQVAPPPQFPTEQD